MLTVTIADAKTRLSELIDHLPQEEVIVITRHGQPVARLTMEPKTRLVDHSISQPTPLDADASPADFGISEVGTLTPR